jgi:hypothetical protein
MKEIRNYLLQSDQNSLYEIRMLISIGKAIWSTIIIMGITICVLLDYMDQNSY